MKTKDTTPEASKVKAVNKAVTGTTKKNPVKKRAANKPEDLKLDEFLQACQPSKVNYNVTALQSFFDKLKGKSSNVGSGLMPPTGDVTTVLLHDRWEKNTKDLKAAIAIGFGDKTAHVAQNSDMLTHNPTWIKKLPQFTGSTLDELENWFLSTKDQVLELYITKRAGDNLMGLIKNSSFGILQKKLVVRFGVDKAKGMFDLIPKLTTYLNTNAGKRDIVERTGTTINLSVYSQSYSNQVHVYPVLFSFVHHPERGFSVRNGQLTLLSRDLGNRQWSHHCYVATGRHIQTLGSKALEPELDKAKPINNGKCPMSSFWGVANDKPTTKLLDSRFSFII